MCVVCQILRAFVVFCFMWVYPPFTAVQKPKLPVNIQKSNHQLQSRQLQGLKNSLLEAPLSFQGDSKDFLFRKASFKAAVLEHLRRSKSTGTSPDFVPCPKEWAKRGKTSRKEGGK